MRLGYARCSTDEQEGSLQAQILRLEQAGCDKVISELVSGRKNDREGILEATALVKAGKVRELVVTRVDRLGRDAANTDLLLALCAEKQVEVSALDGGVIETASPQGFLMARLHTSLAEVESRMLSVRIKKAMTVHRQQGRHLRRRKPFGYMGGPNHQLVPDPNSWDHAKRVLRELKERGSFSKVSQTLPEWCPWTPATNSLHSWFCNPVIRGHLGHLKDGGQGWKSYYKQMLYDQHEPLISEAEWQALAEILKRARNRFKPKDDSRFAHALTGVLKCANCGHNLRYNTSGGTAWWRCRHRLCKERGGIKEEIAMKVVIDACIVSAENLAKMIANPAKEDPVLAAKRKDLSDLEELARRWPDAVSTESLRREIAELERYDRSSIDLKQLNVYRRMMRDPKFYRAMPDELHPVFRMVLLEVRVAAGGGAVAVPRTA